MDIKTAKMIFYVGTISSAVLFLGLTYDTHRQFAALTHADKLSDEVVAGKRVFQKHNCNDCHTILGFGGYYAPDLTKVYSRRGEAYIRRILKEPEVVLSKSFRKMPQQHLTDQEIDRLVAFFAWVDGIDTHNWPPQDARRQKRAALRTVAGTGLSLGAAVFKENQCFECHKLGGVGGNVGPALDDVGARLTPEQIRQQIVDPTSLHPNSSMPPYNELSESELQALVDFLSKQVGGSK